MVSVFEPVRAKPKSPRQPGLARTVLTPPDTNPAGHEPFSVTLFESPGPCRSFLRPFKHTDDGLIIFRGTRGKFEKLACLIPLQVKNSTNPRAKEIK